MHAITALTHYSRARFIQNLLPLLRLSTTLRRVVTVFAGDHEGPIITSDYQGRNIPFLSVRGHGASIITLSLEALAGMAPEVSFIHSYPGLVKTNITRDLTGMMISMKVFLTIIGPIFVIRSSESGARHLFLATSARYPARMSTDDVAGVPMIGKISVAMATDGMVGGGVYSVDSNGEGPKIRAVGILAKLRGEGMKEKVWVHTESEFGRITGLEAT